jgi:benzoyl-CoA 2,3-dioxygenase component B
MLTEEAHHLFVGESGVGRILQRTAEVMAREGVSDPADVRKHGVIDLPTIQRYLNFHFSVTLDLYGSEVSSNASTFYTSGLKGRFEEEKLTDDHDLSKLTYPVLHVEGDRLVSGEDNALMTLNERLRDDYIVDCRAGVDRWNKILKRAGSSFELALPHKAFNRKIGLYSKLHVDPAGRVVGEAEWLSKKDAWLPTDADHAFIASLMGRVTEPGKYASYIAPPARGIGNQPVDFEYVRFS